MNSSLKKILKNSVNFYGAPQRNFSKSVYLWTDMPKLAPKAGGLTAYTIPKGTPKRIEAFDNLDVE
jgi:hypothetical protein